MIYIAKYRSFNHPADLSMLIPLSQTVTEYANIYTESLIMLKHHLESVVVDTGVLGFIKFN